MASKIASGLAFVVLCVAMFDVSSALVVTRGFSPWLALAVGAAAFPIVPVAWHVVGERKRRAASSMSTGWARFVYRTLGVAAIAVATVVVTARGNVKPALRDHLLWILPGHTVWFPSDPPPVGSRAMCEAYATMEMKCEDITGTYEKLVELCKVVTDFDHRVAGFTSNISVSEKCAIKTTSCDDYHECEHGHD